MREGSQAIAIARRDPHRREARKQRRQGRLSVPAGGKRQHAADDLARRHRAIGAPNRLFGQKAHRIEKVDVARGSSLIELVGLQAIDHAWPDAHVGAARSAPNDELQLHGPAGTHPAGHECPEHGLGGGGLRTRPRPRDDGRRSSPAGIVSFLQGKGRNPHRSIGSLCSRNFQMCLKKGGGHGLRLCIGLRVLLSLSQGSAVTAGIVVSNAWLDVSQPPVMVLAVAAVLPSATGATYLRSQTISS